jgi:hypothetical protein
MINKKVILGLPKVLENVDAGVLEYRSIEKRHQTFSHYSITPVLQHGETDSN